MHPCKQALVHACMCACTRAAMHMHTHITHTFTPAQSARAHARTHALLPSYPHLLAHSLDRSLTHSHGRTHASVHTAGTSRFCTGRACGSINRTPNRTLGPTPFCVCACMHGCIIRASVGTRMCHPRTCIGWYSGCCMCTLARSDGYVVVAVSCSSLVLQWPYVANGYLLWHSVSASPLS